MGFSPLDGYMNIPLITKPEDPHMGIRFDYEFSKKRMGDQICLFIHSWIIDHRGSIFSRKATYSIALNDEFECITKHIKDHMISMGLEDMSCRKLMRYFEIDKSKHISYITYF